MIDLYGMASGALNAVEPLREIQIFQSTGEEQTYGYGMRASYSNPQPILADVQSVSGQDIQFVQNIAQQGDYRVVYLQASAHAINCPLGCNGDLLFFDGTMWKITQVLEEWDNWRKVFVTREIEGQQTHGDR